MESYKVIEHPKPPKFTLQNFSLSILKFRNWLKRTPIDSHKKVNFSLIAFSIFLKINLSIRTINNTGLVIKAAIIQECTSCHGEVIDVWCAQFCSVVYSCANSQKKQTSEKLLRNLQHVWGCWKKNIQGTLTGTITNPLAGVPFNSVDVLGLNFK